MAFSKIDLRNFRCFESLSLDLSSNSIMFFGKNGCGKTSILESIYVAASGRSFRTSNLESLIKKGSKAFTIMAFDENTGSIIEINKTKSKPINIKINNSKATLSELARAFPVFSIDSKTFFYNDNGPEYRRKALDRGLFIASPDYAKHWFGYFRSLKQRNSALKFGDFYQVRAYDSLLVDHGERLNAIRQNLVFEVKKIYHQLIQKLLIQNNRAEIFSKLDIFYKPGFDSELGFMESLLRAKFIDQKKRLSTVGPHKSDIIFESKGLLIKDTFSRGEQKLLSIIWSISQNIYLGKIFNLSPILLLDDISSELDSEMLKSFLSIIKYIENRFIFSNIVDPFNSKIRHREKLFKKFHVEQFIQ